MAVNLLLSYAYHGNTDLTAVRAGLHCGSIMLDSGAFTAHTLGTQITVAGYAAWLERWRGCWDHAITLDTIGDPVATRRATAKLHARGLAVLPVFTTGDRLVEFDAMVAEHRYVAVGGLVGMKPSAVIPRVRMLQRRARDVGGGIHALGVGALSVLRAARPYSADATNAEAKIGFGSLMVYDGMRLREVRVQSGPDIARRRDVLVTHGVDLAAIVRHGRFPPGSRPVTQVAQTYAYACTDEELHRARVPAPVAGHRSGTVFYIATTAHARLAIAADDAMHNGRAPAVWRRHGRGHTCHRAREASTTSGGGPVP